MSVTEYRSESAILIEQITQAALALPDELQMQLIDELLASLERTTDPALSTTRLTGAKKRRETVIEAQKQPLAGAATLAGIPTSPQLTLTELLAGIVEDPEPEVDWGRS
ncbi:MAG: hypothetical protein HC910_10895 [Spirulinaceae cyanobacterium SM2_1_0]|nr:hypothetical protein [Spirulinaceae cyanobacterium SM2_1_0]